MKRLGDLGRGLIVVLFLLAPLCLSAETFTSDTFIDANDLSSDGQDIIVSNCTLTVDGFHGFNSLQIQDGGVLTHSLFTNGVKQLTFSVSAEPHVLTATNFATLINTNIDTNTIVVTDTSATFTYVQNVDYLVTLSNQFTRLQLTTNSAIAPGATVLVSYNWQENYQGFSLVISNDMQVASGGAVNVSGNGYAGGNGFGGGAGGSQTTNFPMVYTAGGGGGHGGAGGLSTSIAMGGASYDSDTNPATLGSGGGTGSDIGGSGGGSARLFVGGMVQLDGVISADGSDGTNTYAGGGAGGSILITGQTFSGSGSISASGGKGNPPNGGGGGGGRIAIYSLTNNFSGTISAIGGAGFGYGGAGTVYLQSGTQPGQLLIGNGGVAGTNTTFSALSISNLTIYGGAIAQSQNPTFAVSNLLVGSNSEMITLSNVALSLTVNGTATVESNSAISADFRSFSGSGAGNASCGAGSGGSYGGFGGGSVCSVIGASTYGSLTQPSNLGSPGGGNPVTPAGGAINLAVAGNLSLNGIISANGAASVVTNGGGGSAGSVWLTVGTLSGSGFITANGGAANNPLGGGGGGGRIAVYFNTNLYGGTINAYGGAGTNAGGAGTIYLKTNSASIAQVLLDNNGLTGFTSFSSSPGLLDLTITNSATLTNFQGFSLRNLSIASNSWLAGVISFTATNGLIQSGGGIRSDGQSTFSGGQTRNSTGGGGSFGGYGGFSASNALGGQINSFSVFNVNSGSGGGSGVGSGGSGGGSFILLFTGTLQLDGRISADGRMGPTLNSGGGAGGGIQITAGTISGSGTISACGGAGNNLGGGGGGGRLVLSFPTNLFSGLLTAHGGSGFNNGGAGTIYQSKSLVGGSSNDPVVIADNGGLVGTNTPFATNGIPGVFDVFVTGGASLSNALSGNVTFGDLLIGSNSALRIFGGVTNSLTILTNAVIQAGGLINGDGLGGAGIFSNSGQSRNSTGGGGSYGGVGGNSLSNALGGAALVELASAPVSLGNPGGQSGGSGGGGLRMIVDGTLQLDGGISIQGYPGTNLNSGGGSGGSVWLSVTKFSGTGFILVNGGAANGVGGGGGGGRMAINYATNSFTGMLTSYGGMGTNCGGAGTVYTSSSFSGMGRHLQVFVDNSGFPGVTVFEQWPNFGQFPFDLTIKGRAICEMTNGLGDSFGFLGNLFIGSNCTYIPGQTLANYSLSVQSNATIEAGALINVDGVGLSQFTSEQGNGHIQSGTGGGGGNGGVGGMSASNAAGGVIIDSIAAPFNPGGTGGAGATLSGSIYPVGGGLFLLFVNGNLQFDGAISANGYSPTNLNCGGGAGGGVSINAGVFAGKGSIVAKGGTGNNLGGGGGGGRIVIESNTNLFTGTVTAKGGVGFHNGGAGTIYLNSSFKGNGQHSQLIVDNGGLPAGWTPILSPTNALDVFVTNGAAMTLGSATPITLNSLTLSSNSSLGAATNFPALNLNITNLTIPIGAAILLDGEGSLASTGVGHGSVNSSTGSGGGHGGVGSASATFSGGPAYDSIITPTIAGSGGGSSSLIFVNSGSSGGGALRLTVEGTLDVEGIISANGAWGSNSISGPVVSGGGGSGGSLWLNAGTIAGGGKITADGGGGYTNSGGGGGGRIAVYFNSNAFTGTFSAHGGTGVGLAGGAGTIYLQTNSAPVGTLIVDNGGFVGTNTPLGTVTQAVALSLRGSALANSTVPLTLQSLSIDSGALFCATSHIALNLTVLGDALVDTNGGIVADAMGFNPPSGPGSGSVDSSGNGSGGGYGGAGGASFAGAAGGVIYESSNLPADFGSAGGMTNAKAGFSQGGGAIRMVVDGNLTVNGNISANGNDATTNNVGGGSGGSIWITAQNLAGYGSLTANGGMGFPSTGGSGGGGRIAIYASDTNLFIGSATALGGAGWSPGQNGTVVFATNLTVSGNVTDTNGLGVAGIDVEGSGGTSATTDGSGLYSLGVPLFWAGSVTPMGDGFFLPNLRNYSVLSSNVSNQNFLVALPSDFNFSGSQFDGTNANFSWYGINGVSYQPLYSSNLVNWAPYGLPVVGSNGPSLFGFPITNAPQGFFRLGVRY